MTLTLYIYDSDGNEMAWVTADPYEYSVADFVIDDPDTFLRLKLEGLRSIREYGSDRLNPDRGAGHVDTMKEIGLEPREHLEEVEETVLYYCDSTEIVDE